MTRPRAIGWVMAVWLAVGAGSAAGQQAGPDDAAIRAAHERGLALVLDGRYREALTEFSTGYEISRRPLFLFNMAECARKLDDHARARELYERYLREDPSGRLSETAKQRLRELEPSTTGGGAKPATAASPRGDSSPNLAPAQAVTAPPPEPASLAVTRSVDAEPARPLWKKWPFWAGVGTAVALGTAAVFVLRNGDDCGNCVDLRDP